LFIRGEANAGDRIATPFRKNNFPFSGGNGDLDRRK
jgi:hypothetical protein